MDSTTAAALVDEAAKRSALIWVRSREGSGPAQPMWHVWSEGTAYLLTGGVEQPAPSGLDQPGAQALITIRSKDKWTRLVTVVAGVDTIAPGSSTWDELVPTLQSKRLNSRDGDAAPQRWASDCRLFALRPTGEVLETPDDPSTESHAAPPPATAATTVVPRPWHLFGRTARRRKAHR